MSEPWVAMAYGLVITMLVAVAVYALVVSAIMTRKDTGAECPARRVSVAAPGAEGPRRPSPPTGAASVDDFVTARRSVGVWKLAFSFYAGAMGAWAVTAPAEYAAFAGLLGLGAYALSAGAPLVVLAYAGQRVRKAYPDAMSLPDFLRRRFSHEEQGSVLGLRPGDCAATLAALVTLQAMVLGMLAEYSAIGSLFSDYVGCGRWAWVPTLLMAILTMSYTVSGGLYVSILTDRVQAVCSLLLVLGIAALLGGRGSDSYPELTADQKGFSYAGYSSLVSMPLSLVACTLYSEAVWQRVWASEDDRALVRASWMGALCVSAVVFFFGFVGFLAVWTGRAPGAEGGGPPPLTFFAYFSKAAPARLDSAPGLAALVCAALMSEGAVDSFQMGITSTLATTLLKGRSLWSIRALTVLVNLPLAVLGATSLVSSVLSLFLVSNLLTVVGLVPLGLTMLPGARARELVTERSLLCGYFSGVLGLTLYGCFRVGTFGGENSFLAGLKMAWMDNDFGFDYFLAAVGASVVGLVGAIASTAAAAPPRRAPAAATVELTASGSTPGGEGRGA